MSNSITLSAQTLPEVYIGYGTEHPDRLFARILNGDEDTPTIEISWARVFDDARRAAAHLVSVAKIEQRVAGSDDLVTVGLLASSSYTFHVYEVACFLLGWTPVMLSGKNRFTALEHLLRSASATAVLVDNTYATLGQDLANAIPDLKLLKMDADAWPGLEPYERPAYCGESTDAEKDKPALYLHTSGSTGLPKLIPISHGFALSNIRAGLGVGNQYLGDSIYGPLPLSHGLGFCMFIVYPLGSGVVPTFVVTKYPLNAEAVMFHLKRLPQCIAFIPPAILEDVVTLGDPGLDMMAQCKRVIYAGAPLRQSSGDRLVERGTKLITGFGMTEVPAFVKMDVVSDNLREDWTYLRFLEHNTMTFLPVDEGGRLKELIISSGKDGAKLAVINHHEPEGFATKDIWAPHPTIAGLWKHAGRTDSMVALSNGLKVNCKQIDTILRENLGIAYAVPFGAGKLNIGVIIAPVNQQTNAEDFIQEIWPTVEKLNSLVPKHATLLKDMIIIQSPSKPFILTAKHSVKTKDTLDLYAEEIKQAYAKLEGSGAEEVVGPALTAADIFPSVIGIVKGVLGRDVPADANLFDKGVDSLNAIQIRSGLMKLLPQLSLAGETLPSLIVYQNPTIHKLAKFLESKMTGVVVVESVADQCNRLNALIKRYTPGTDIFILSGATGTLGSHILDSLLARNEVRKVYCFGRKVAGVSSAERTRSTFVTYGLNPAILDTGRVEYFDVDLSQRTFGLDGEVFAKLQAEVTHIVHTSWHMNFNAPVEEFERGHIAGVHHLLEMAINSARPVRPHFTFISSISAAGDAPGIKPEIPFLDPSVVAHQNGYSQSKYVAERIIDRVAAETGLQCSVVRCGQLSGSSISGMWNAAEHVPILLQSSVEMKMIPDKFESEVRWLPIDIAADIVTKVSYAPPAVDARKQTSSTAYWHLQNPSTDPWSEVVRSMVKQTGGRVKAVPHAQWIQALEKAYSEAESTGNRKLPPAVKLLEFYRKVMTSQPDSVAILDTTKTAIAFPEVVVGSIVSNSVLDKYVQRVVERVQ